jgi:hypothetical protein
MSLSINLLTTVAPAVQCSACGQWHGIDAASYITIVGDIRLGANFSIYPTNLDESGRVEKATILCRNDKCTLALMEALTKADPDYEKIADRTRTWRPQFDQPTTTREKAVLLTPAPVGSPWDYVPAVPPGTPLDDGPLILNAQQQAAVDALAEHLVKTTEPVTKEMIEEAISATIVPADQRKAMDAALPAEPAPSIERSVGDPLVGVPLGDPANVEAATSPEDPTPATSAASDAGTPAASSSTNSDDDIQKF